MPARASRRRRNLATAAAAAALVATAAAAAAPRAAALSPALPPTSSSSWRQMLLRPEDPPVPGQVAVVRYPPAAAGFSRAAADGDLRRLVRDNLDPDLRPFREAAGRTRREGGGGGGEGEEEGARGGGGGGGAGGGGLLARAAAALRRAATGGEAAAPPTRRHPQHPPALAAPPLTSAWSGGPGLSLDAFEDFVARFDATVPRHPLGEGNAALVVVRGGAVAAHWLRGRDNHFRFACLKAAVESARSLRLPDTAFILNIDDFPVCRVDGGAWPAEASEGVSGVDEGGAGAGEGEADAAALLLLAAGGEGEKGGGGGGGARELAASSSSSSSSSAAATPGAPTGLPLCPFPVLTNYKRWDPSKVFREGLLAAAGGVGGGAGGTGAAGSSSNATAAAAESAAAAAAFGPSFETNEVLLPVLNHHYEDAYFFPWSQKREKALMRASQQGCMPANSSRVALAVAAERQAAAAAAAAVAAAASSTHQKPTTKTHHQNPLQSSSSSSSSSSLLLDAGVVRIDGRDKHLLKKRFSKAGFVPIEDHAKWKYLVSADGCVAQTRLAKVLLSNSVVLKEDSDWIEYYYRSLQPWTHYAPFRHRKGASAGESGAADGEVVRVVEGLKKDDGKAAAIAAAGQRFAYRNLGQFSRLLYLRRLLVEYNALFGESGTGREMEEWVREGGPERAARRAAQKRVVGVAVAVGGGR
jgi:hypothetical protein